MKYNLWTLLIFTGVCCVQAHVCSGADGPRAFGSYDTMVTIEWSGAVTKSVFEAAWATTNLVNELKDWKLRYPPVGARAAELEKRRVSGNFRLTAEISNQEATNLTRLFMGAPPLKKGKVPIPQYSQQYIARISSGGRDHYIELGFSTNIIPFLVQIRGCLNAESRLPVETIIEQASRWQR